MRNHKHLLHKNKQWLWVLLLGTLWLPTPTQAQITAQGQGGKLVAWTGLGVEQSLGKRWVNKHTLAYSRHSQLDNTSILQQAGVFTVREEFAFRLSQRFTLSNSLMYARRWYEDAEHPAFLNEIRVYPRIDYAFRLGRVKLSQYLRTDFRFFSAPGFKAYQQPFEFRTRYLIKGSIPLTGDERNFLIVMTELLAASEQETDAAGNRHFSDFHFTENRSSVYYRHRFEHPDVYVDLGVMNQEWVEGSGHHLRETLLLQLDLIFINPFAG